MHHEQIALTNLIAYCPLPIIEKFSTEGSRDYLTLPESSVRVCVYSSSDRMTRNFLIKPQNSLSVTDAPFV